MKNFLATNGFVAVLVLCSVAMLGGCSEDAPGQNKEEATYQGKAASEWLRQAEDKDRNAVREAEKALLQLSHDSDEARNYMKNKGEKDAAFLLELALAVGDGKSSGSGDEFVWIEFVDSCHAYARLTENWWVKAESLVEIGGVLEDALDLKGIDETARKVFDEQVNPVLSRHRDNPSQP